MSRKLNPLMLSGTITKGLSISHENLSTASSVVNNNISIQKSGEVLYEPSPLPEEEPKIELTNDDYKSQIEFLKAVIRLYVTQKIYFSGKYIVCDSDELKEMIHLITGGEVEIEAEPIEVSCLSTKISYSKIITIWVSKDGQRTVFKYQYPEYLTLFDECKVSLKYVRINL